MKRRFGPLVASFGLVALVGTAPHAVQWGLLTGVGNGTGPQQGEILQSRATFDIISVIALLVAGVVGCVVAGRLPGRVRRLRDTTDHLSLDEPGQRVPLPSSTDDDVAVLAATFNNLIDRLERGTAEHRQFLDNASRQLAAPLAAVRRHLELLSAHDAESAARSRTLLLKELEQIQRLVNDFQVLAGSRRPDFIHAEWIDVDQFLEEALQRAKILGRRRWTLSVKPGGWVLADRQRVSQAVDQLTANALTTTSEDDTISLGGVWADSPATSKRSGASAARVSSALIGGLDIWVSDTRSRIPAVEHQRINDRYALSGPMSPGESSCLGLPIVKAIAEAHGGSVRVHSAARGGSRFTLWLPARLDIIRQRGLCGQTLQSPEPR
ncbi:sensor histidine kinase [Arthrobacter sp. CG_A4]|uniref:sensor histidine kinase n=1 Tax=Arthrobacter sp. CG_A4 TaxID=3071706 RepID=UPI002E133F2B